MTIRCLPWRSMTRCLASALALLTAVGALADSAPLFTSDEPLVFTLEAPFSEFHGGEGGRPEIHGTVKLVGEDEILDVKLTERGHSRLGMCRFPPLKLNFRRKQVEGTVFAGQNKLKLVTQCKGSGRYERYLRQEYSIYKAYEELSEAGFRVRWTTITYRDPEEPSAERTHPAFLIESLNEVAARLGRERITLDRVPSDRLDPLESTRYTLFQYLIGNTDWSMIAGADNDGCCHNGKLLALPGSDTQYVVIPYDFDQAGLINTDYAEPAEVLKIRSVRQRVFRGRCIHNDQLDTVIAQFNEKREAIATHLAPPGVSKSTNKKTRNYVDEFYDTINDPRARKRRILDVCLAN
ncbi:MAG: hypothetical protein AAFN78_07670 [Pseudomonadota bacterium]